MLPNCAANAILAVQRNDERWDGPLAMAKQSSDGAIVIKKYANRRLYNTAKSSYVTLDDLSHMVRAGEDFRVFDAKSGEDITRSVLTQIIFEQEAKEGQNMLPTSFLRQLIRLYGDTLQSVVPGYLEASMETFSRNQEQLRETFVANPAMASFETLARSNIEWMERAMRMFGSFGPPVPGAEMPGQPQAAAEPPKPAAKADNLGIGEDLDQLQKQIREMQSQLEQLSKGKSDG